MISQPDLVISTNPTIGIVKLWRSKTHVPIISDRWRNSKPKLIELSSNLTLNQIPTDPRSPFTYFIVNKYNYKNYILEPLLKTLKKSLSNYQSVLHVISVIHFAILLLILVTESPILFCFFGGLRIFMI